MTAPAKSANRLLRQTQNYTRVQGIFAAALAVAAGLFYAAIYRPQQEQLADLNRQIAFKRLELTADQSQTDRLPRVTSELAALKRRLAGFKKLPDDPQYGQFIREVNQAVQRTALQKFNEVPGKATRLDLFSEQPIVLTFQGSFPSVFAFIRQLEDMERLTRLRDVTITTIDPEKGTVDVKLSVNIYYAEG
jgi:Tfp pilus assembly protein PilO